MIVCVVECVNNLSNRLDLSSRMRVIKVTRSSNEYIYLYWVIICSI